MATVKSKEKAVATAKATRSKQAAQRKRRRGRDDEGGFIILALMGVGGLGILESVLGAITLIGLVPSIVMSITDRHVLRSARLQCVVLLNATGIVPYAMQVYNNPSAWQEIAVNPLTIIVMWGSAFAGYVLLYIGPKVGAILLQAYNQDKLKSLTGNRQELIDLWGPEVIGDTGRSAAKQTEDTSNFIQPKKKLS